MGNSLHTSCRQPDQFESEAPLSPVQTYATQNDQALAIEMCCGAASGDLERIQHLINKRAKINQGDYDQRTALHLATANGHLDIVQKLLEARADVQTPDRWGHTALDEAARGGYQDIQAALRIAGATNGSTPRTRSPPPTARKGRQSFDGKFGAGLKLCCAAAAGKTFALEELLHSNINVNAADYDGRSALHVATAHGQTDTVKWLVGMKASVDLQDHFGLTPLAEALRHKRDELIEVLQEHSNITIDPDLDFLKKNPDSVHWNIKADEVHLDQVLSTTLKSTIYTGIWRGTKVVAKTSGVVDHRMHSDDQDEVQALAKKEMLHEIKLLSTMRHPDLVLFLGACLDHSPLFFLTEFMEGGDLQHFYDNKKRQKGHPYRPSSHVFLKWASAIARALSFLHNSPQPVIHRDLKPMNLFLTKSMDLKVADFGISKLMQPNVSGAMLSPTEPVMSGGVGTWRYMAPEVVRYEWYTDRVDIYSFALIMWFMSTGLDPFVEQFGKDAEIVLKEFLKGKEPRPDVAYNGARYGPSLPKNLHQFIKDCWHPSAQSRPAAIECTQKLATLSVPGSAIYSLTKFFQGSS
mmetsp:Transcript_72366/g.143482  ORF Transcript_72366/g.143482 Transcript_72366/m.143482 type:complete len:579 (-) Transcript_72366:210-1946(-)